MEQHDDIRVSFTCGSGKYDAVAQRGEKVKAILERVFPDSPFGSLNVKCKGRPVQAFTRVEALQKGAEVVEFELSQLLEQPEHALDQQAPGHGLQLGVVAELQFPKDVSWNEDQCLGSGAFASVYRGYLHRANDLPVAVKVFPHRYVNKLRMEVQAYKKLVGGEGVVRVYGAEEFTQPHHCWGGYIVFEYVDMTLCEWLKEHAHRMRDWQVLRLANDVARGMQSIAGTHLELRTRHGDLAPDNVLVSGSIHGTCFAKLADFGEAHSASADGVVSGKGVFIDSRAKQLSSGGIHSDVWAFGILLWEMVYALRARKYASAQDLGGALVGRDLVTKLVRMIQGSPFEHIVAKCCATEATECFSTWEQVIDSLNAVKVVGDLVDKLRDFYLDLSIPVFGGQGSNLSWSFEAGFQHPHVIQFAVTDQEEQSSKRKLACDNVVVNGWLKKKTDARIAILGKAGAGKSTWCKSLAWRWARNGTESIDVDAVVYVDLRTLVRSSPPIFSSLPELLRSYWSLVGLSAELAQVERFLEAKEIVFVFDGLDEARRESSQWIQKLLKDVLRAEWEQYRGKKVIVSGRAEEHDYFEGNWTVLEMVGHQVDMRDQLIVRFCEVFDESKSMKGNGLVQLLRENEELADIASIPLQAQLLSLVYLFRNIADEELPTCVPSLYHQAIPLFLIRGLHENKDFGTWGKAEWKSAKVAAISVIPDLQEMARKDVIDFVAFEGLANHQNIIKRSGIVVKAWTSCDAAVIGSMSEFDVDLAEADAWEWYHSSFRDYFTACRAVERASQLGRDAKPWDVTLAFHDEMGAASDLTFRIALWKAKTGKVKLFNQCFHGWLIQHGRLLFNHGILRLPELIGWKEAVADLDQRVEVLSVEFVSAAHNIAAISECEGDYERAQRQYFRCLSLEERLSQSGNIKIVSLMAEKIRVTRHNILMLKLQMGHGAEALGEFQLMLQQEQKGTDVYYHLVHAIADGLSDRCEGSDLKEAIIKYEECLEWRRKRYLPNLKTVEQTLVNKNYLQTLHNLAIACSKSGDIDRALRFLQECFDGRLEVCGMNDPCVWTTQKSIAFQLGKRKDYALAFEKFEECLVEFARIYGTKQHIHYVQCLSCLCSALLKASELMREKNVLLRKARERFQECLPLSFNQYGEHHSAYWNDLQGMAYTLSDAGEKVEAFKQFYTLLKLKKRFGRPDELLLTKGEIGRFRVKIPPNKPCPICSSPKPKNYKKCCAKEVEKLLND